MKSPTHLPAGALLSLTVLLSPVYSDSASWNGGTDALWSNTANWDGPPTAVPAGDEDASFSSGVPTNTTVDLGAGVTIKTINFGSGPSITIGSGAVNSQTLTRANGGNFFANSNVDHLFNAAIVLGEVGDASSSFRFQNQGTTNLFTLAGDISNNGSDQTLSKAGLGTLLLSGTNTHGATNVDNGQLIIGSDGALVSNKDLTVRSQNTASGINTDVTVDIAGHSVAVNKLRLGHTTSSNFGAGQTPMVIDSVGGGVIDLNSVSGIVYDAGTASKLNGTATIAADVTWQTNNSWSIEDGGSNFDVEFSGNIVDTPGNAVNALFISGPGKILFTSTNNNNVSLIGLRGGSLAFSDDAQLGTNDVALGRSNANGTLEYVGAGGTVNNQIRVGEATGAGGGFLLSNGVGAVNYSAATFNQAVSSTVARALTFGGNNTDANTIEGIIQDNTGDSPAISIIKQDAGKWVLDGVNTYTGTTSVNAGRLDIGNDSPAATGAFSVAAGASLGGEGSVGGNVTLGSGSSPANLHIDASSDAEFSTSGDLDVSNGVTVFFDSAAGGDVIEVISYGGSLTGTTGDFVLDGSVPFSARPDSVSFTDNVGTIELVLGYKSLTWENTSSDGLWNINTSANWTGGDTVFFDGDFVTFTDAAAGTVVLAENITAGSALFNNATTDYIIDGTAGTEVLTVNNGLTVDGAANVTINAILAGSGTLLKGEPIGDADGVQNGGKLTLSGDNSSFTGDVHLTEGILSITHENALGTGAVTMTDQIIGVTNSDPVLDIDANGLNIANDITVGNDGWNKRIRFDHPGTGNEAELSGTVSFNETTDRITSVTAGTGETLTISGPISGGGVLNVRDGSGTVKLSNETGDHTGVLMVQSGAVLEITSIADAGVASAAGAGSKLTLGYRNSSGTIRYTGDGDSTDRQIRIGEDYTGANSTGAGSFEASGTGALIFTNSAFNQPEVGSWVGARTLTLGGTSTDDNEIQGTIADNNDGTIDVAVTLVKDGIGKWILSGTNTYTGDTTVSDGILAVDGDAIPDTGTLIIDGTGQVEATGIEIVAALTLGGEVQVTPGTYGATGSGANTINDTYFSGTAGVVSLGAPVGFSSWITGTFGNGTVPGDEQGPEDDWDKDGISNLLEYALDGFDPTVSDGPAGTLTGLLVTYTKRAGASGISYSLEESTDLGVTDPWDTATPTTDDSSEITYTLTPPTPTKNFVRLVVVE